MPKQQVEFFDNPRTYGEIHHNQIFKFVDNFEKFSKSNNRKLQFGIYEAKKLLTEEERD